VALELDAQATSVARTVIAAIITTSFVIGYILWGCGCERTKVPPMPPGGKRGG
jgi:hypothetical protein